MLANSQDGYKRSLLCIARIKELSADGRTGLSRLGGRFGLELPVEWEGLDKKATVKLHYGNSSEPVLGPIG